MLNPDSSEYLNQRDNLLRHGSVYQGNPEEPHRWYLETRRPPLTGLILAAIRLVSASPVAILLIQNLLSIAVILWAVKLSLSIYPEVNIKWFYLPVLFFPTQLIYSNLIMAEVFFQVAIFSGFYFLLQPAKGQRLFLFFLFLTLAAFIKPVLWLIWIPLLAAMIYFRKKSGMNLKHFSGPAFCLTAVLLFSFYNYQKTGVFEFSSASESFLPDYVVLPAVHLTDGKEKAARLNEEIHIRANSAAGYPASHKVLISESIQVMKAYPLTIGFIWLKGMVQFFVDPGRWDVKTFFTTKPAEHPDGLIHQLRRGRISEAFRYLGTIGTAELLISLIAVFFNLLLTVSFFIFLSDNRYPLLFRVFAGVLVLYLALLTGPIGSARYRMAVFPLFLLAWSSGVGLIRKLVSKNRELTEFSHL